MAKNKPKTPNQKLFQKEIRNLIKRVKTAEKRGFDFPEDIIPEQPKVIRKSLIERIKNLRGTKLLKKALSYLTEEQIPVTPSEGIKLEKEKRRNQSKIFFYGDTLRRVFKRIKILRIMDVFICGV